MHPSHHAPGHWPQLCAHPHQPRRHLSQAAVSATPSYRPRLTRIGQAAVSATPSGQTVAVAHTSIGHNVVTLSYWPHRRLGRAVIGGRHPFLSLGLVNNQPQLLAKHPNYSPYSFDADDDTLLVAVVDADDTLAAQHPNLLRFC
jgi:hypothetical protein